MLNLLTTVIGGASHCALRAFDHHGCGETTFARPRSQSAIIRRSVAATLTMVTEVTLQASERLLCKSRAGTLVAPMGT